MKLFKVFSNSSFKIWKYYSNSILYKHKFFKNNLHEMFHNLFQCKALSKILIPQSKLCFDSAKKKIIYWFKTLFFREINVTIFLKIIMYYLKNCNTIFQAFNIFFFLSSTFPSGFTIFLKSNCPFTIGLTCNTVGTASL